MKNSIEKWVDVPGYEGYYQVNNYGKVKSLQKTLPCYGGHRTTNERILKSAFDKDGYQKVVLVKDRSKKNWQIHRLLMISFEVPNPYNCSIINHKDENRAHNFIFINPDGTVNEKLSNLEWCTPKYNSNYGNCKNKQRQARYNNTHQSKPVLQYTLDGTLINEFPSQGQAYRETGVFQSNISMACLGKSHNNIAHGYIWKFKES